MSTTTTTTTTCDRCRRAIGSDEPRVRIDVDVPSSPISAMWASDNAPRRLHRDLCGRCFPDLLSMVNYPSLWRSCTCAGPNDEPKIDRDGFCEACHIKTENAANLIAIVSRRTPA